MDIQAFKKPIIDIAKRGPELADYSTLQSFFHQVGIQRKKGLIKERELNELQKWFNGSMSSTDTLQGHACVKPNGYDGDYQIIHKIYKHHKSDNPVYEKWDNFFHLGDAPKAVRNRKKYFVDKLTNLDDGARVLNLASGPCDDLLEFKQKTNKDVHIDCIDMDNNAIEFAKEMLGDISGISFHRANVLKFTPKKKYDLIWSAGLFDYFNDKGFSMILRRLSNFVKPNGKIILGNFNEGINSQSYMEFGNWYLNYRNPDKLLKLSEKVECKSKIVESEELNVNLFLNLQF